EVGNEWLLEASSIPLQQSLRHLQSAYDNFFKGLSKYPTFKSKKDKHQSIEYTINGFSFRKRGKHTGRIFIAKSKEPLNIKWSRELPSDPTSLTIVRNSAGQWFVSFVIEEDQVFGPIPVKVVGIDLGVKTLATISDGTIIDNPKYQKKYQGKLTKAQQTLSKKKLGSKNRDKAKLRVAKIHTKNANCRQDNISKFTTKLSNENQVIVIEDLHVRDMLTTKKSNSNLKRGISDASFRMIRSQLEYKTLERGTDLVVINQYFPSSQLCSSCGARKRNLTLSDRIYICNECGLEIDRDLNAAKNILAAGLADRLNDCGDSRRPEGALPLPESVYETVSLQA
ncbi:transposase, partial [Candidatus Pacearchaeota archaeon]|nr:transposase [Candidatus Pacearchaeota archaeon]